MSMPDDLRFAARTLRRSPGFTALIVLTLAIGVAVNLTIFALIETFLFRTAPGVTARDAVAIYATSKRSAEDVSSFRDFVDFRAQGRTFERMAAWKSLDANVTTGGETSKVRAVLASAGFFETLGVAPAHGRFFRADEDRVPNEAAVAVLSFVMWQRHFGGADVLGRELVLNGRSFRIIGVAPREFRGATISEPADLFVPMMMQPHLMASADNLLDNRGWSGISIVGRPRRGITLAQAQAELSTIAARLAAAFPDTNEGRGATLVPLSRASLPPHARAVARRASSILLIIAAATLTLVCASAANLLLTRGISRIREMAVRLALGAGRLQVVRALIVESLIAVLAGSVAGVLFCIALMRVIRATVPIFSAIAIGPLTLLAAVVLAMLIAMVCAIVPPLVSTKLQMESLRSMPGSTVPGIHRLTAGIVVMQVALSIVLLAATGLFLRSLANLRGLALGYDTQRLIATGLLVPPRGDGSNVARHHRLVLERVRAMPGVESATLGSIMPLAGDSDGTRARPEGAPREDAIPVATQIVGTEYFSTLSIALLRGREFVAADAGPPRSAIINRTLASRFWPGTDAVGRTIQLGGGGPVLEVIGVVEDSRFGSLREDLVPTMFLSSAQAPEPEIISRMMLFVRARSADSSPVARDLGVLLRGIDPNVPVMEIQTLDGLRDQATTQERTLSTVLGATSLLALLLAALGIYGVLSLSVALRTRELGVRIALGATPARVIAGTLQRGLRLAAAGILLGALIVAALRGAIAPLLFETTVTDPRVWIAVATCLAAVVAAAGLGPARRAGRVDPARVLQDQ